jgi:LPXTG-site transpeptidase (sortase) family protein
MRRFVSIHGRSLLSAVLIVAGIGLIVASYGQVWWSDLQYWLRQRQHVVYSLEPPAKGQTAVKQIVPASKDFGLVIEKIGVNERVAPQIDPYNPKVYLPALLKYGVAEAKGGVPPGQVGTTYLFGHSTINIWEIGQYHAPFTLMNKLELGDRVVVFYQQQRFDYQIADKKVVSPSEVHYLTDKRDTPTLILQTCDPPGQNTKRLLLMAELTT